MKNLLTVLDSINSETDKFVSVFIWLSDSICLTDLQLFILSIIYILYTRPLEAQHMILQEI